MSSTFSAGIPEGATRAVADRGPSWYVLRTKPRAEETCLVELRRKGFEAVCPMIMEYRWRRRQEERVPMFPGYLFASFAWPCAYHEVRWLRGVADLVRFGEGPPPPLSGDLVSFFSSRMDGRGVFMMAQEFRSGDRVKILSEPFRGLIGRVLRSDSAKGRVVILMEFLYQATIEVDSRLVVAL